MVLTRELLHLRLQVTRQEDMETVLSIRRESPCLYIETGYPDFLYCLIITYGTCVNTCLHSTVCPTEDMHGRYRCPLFVVVMSCTHQFNQNIFNCIIHKYMYSHIGSLKPRMGFWHQWPLLPTWFNFNPSIITYPVRCGMKLLIHSQNSMKEPLKFGNGYVISSHTL